MPLTPVRFTSLNDINKLIDKLRKRKLLPSDTEAKLDGATIAKLKTEFLVANNGETYLLSDILESKAEEISYSALTFRNKNFPIPVSERDKLQTDNTLLHNEPLVNELVKLIPEVNIFKVQPQCSKSGKLVVFPVLTQDMKTIEGITEVERIFGSDNIEPSKEQKDYTKRSYENSLLPHTVKEFTPNYALLDLQMLNLNLLPQLSSLSIEERNEKINVIRANLTRIKSLIDAFSEKFPEKQAAKLDPSALEDENTKVVEKMVDYKCKIADAKYNTESSQRSIARRTSTIKVLAALSPLLVTIPSLGYKIHSLHKAKQLQKDRINTQTTLEEIQEDFKSDQSAKAYAQIINPCLHLIQGLQQSLKPISPVNSAAVDYTDPVQYGPNGLQFSLLPPAPRENQPEALRYERSSP